MKTPPIIKRAAEAHTNLSLFAAIQALLESGAVYGGSSGSAEKTATKIIRLCKEEQQRQLAVFDAAIASQKAEGGGA